MWHTTHQKSHNTKSCGHLSDDIFTHLDRIDNTLLACIKLSEDTLNAKEYDSHEVKFNHDFNEFMSRLEHLPRKLLDLVVVGLY